MKYTPKPINTSKIELSEELENLLEYLAKNTHEVWAKQRIEDGWQHGDERSDSKQRHPCLIPYEELPEAEKEYDRHTSKETLKAILLAGFTINRANG